MEEDEEIKVFRRKSEGLMKGYGDRETEKVPWVKAVRATRIDYRKGEHDLNEIIIDERGQREAGVETE